MCTAGEQAGMPDGSEIRLCREGRHLEKDHIMSRLLRRKQVEDLTALSRSSIYDKVSKGEFPRPVSVGPRSVRWLATEVEAFINDRVAMRDGVDQ